MHVLVSESRQALFRIFDVEIIRFIFFLSLFIVVKEILEQVLLTRELLRLLLFLFNLILLLLFFLLYAFYLIFLPLLFQILLLFLC